MRKRGGGKGTNEREKAKTGALFNIKVQSVNTFVSRAVSVFKMGTLHSWSLLKTSKLSATKTSIFV